MTIRININYEISIPDCNIETIIACFKKILLLFLADFVISILTEFAQFYMNQESQPFECEKCGSNNKFIWKTKNAKDTRIGKIFGAIKVGQMQVECKGCGKKVYITRKLLDIAPRKLMSDGTKKVFGVIEGHNILISKWFLPIIQKLFSPGNVLGVFKQGFDGSASLDPSYKKQHGRNIVGA